MNYFTKMKEIENLSENATYKVSVKLNRVLIKNL